jgi:GTP-binding protein
MIDTAGLRRKSRVKDKIEKFSMIKTIRSLERCHIAVILLDAEDGIVEQDARICGFALKAGRGLVLGVNKWDLVKRDPAKKSRLTDAMDRQLPFVSFAPRVTVSALTGERVMELFDRVKLVHEAFSKRIGTGEVNRAVEEMVGQNPPPHIGRTRLKVYYATQVGTRPPKFVAFVNRPDKVHFSYRRFMINQLRERFDLIHTPVRLVFRKRKGREP